MKKEIMFHFRKITAFILVVAMVFGLSNSWNVQPVSASQTELV